LKFACLRNSSMKRNGARSFLGDFKDFINQGNVVDLAVAVVIGGAFGKVVDALVSLVVGGVLEPAMKKAGAASIASWPAGSLLVALINFVVIAFVVFLIVRALENMKRRDARATDAAPDPQEQLALAASRLADALESRRI
jgi:large conductance mechanosensitive channel